jgi:hypothetical protein
MRGISSFFGVVVGLAVIVLAARFLGLEDFIRRSIEAGHLLDWVMGSLSLVWLLVILKAPWDLYFQAQAVAFEQQRSRERGIELTAGRETYVVGVRRRLLWFAIGAHLFSAALIAGVTYFTKATTGYYFAAFYLLSTLFRPTVAAYVYLAEKLKAVGEESRYPREDVEELRRRVDHAEAVARAQGDDLSAVREELAHAEARAEARATELEMQITDQRQRLHALTREFEATVSRLTDNQEVIKGIQAFVRLIRNSAE